MKADSERKKYYNAKLHERKKHLHAHLSKELRGKLTKKKRSILLHKGDKVKIVRGARKGKIGKIAKLCTSRRKVYIEGLTVKTARAKEVLVPIQPSNLAVLELVSTPERKDLFQDIAFLEEKVHDIPSQVKKPDSSYTHPTSLNSNLKIGKTYSDEYKEIPQKSVEKKDQVTDKPVTSAPEMKIPVHGAAKETGVAKPEAKEETSKETKKPTHSEGLPKKISEPREKVTMHDRIAMEKNLERGKKK